MGPVGLEPTFAGLKVRCLANSATTPQMDRTYLFQSVQHLLFLPSGSPEDRTRHHVVISRVWATSPRLPQSQSGWQDSNLRSRAPRARGSAATPHPVRQSERPDLNRRFLHGEQGGYRYIMGALKGAGLSKTKSTGRDSNPRNRNTGAVSSPLDDQCISSGAGGT